MENNKSEELILNSNRRKPKFNLSQEELFRLMYLSGRVLKSEKQQFETKTPWECLHCGAPIFINYDASGRKSIFCREHKSYMLVQTIVQARYIKRLKDEQLETIKMVDKNYYKFMSDI